MHVDLGHTPWRSMPASIVPQRVVFVMPTDTRSKPQPTPNPDQPAQRRTAIRAESSPQSADPEPPDSDDRDEPVYDSCIDDLNLILSQPFPSRTRP